MKRRHLLLSAIILSAASTVIAGDAPTKRPTWCQAGWECVTTKELAADATYHLDLREQAARYRLRARRLGLTVGFGLGVGGVVDKDFTVRYVPTGGAFLVWGLRF